MVFPYEEKGVERALIFAAVEVKVETLGFTPHPQHPLAISMRDRDDSNCPKPTAYAVCGPAYVNFFRDWANKATQRIDVWGSQKGMPLTEVPAYRDVPKYPRVLLALSHSNELLVFKSWLEAQPELCADAEIALRRYMAVDVGEFESGLADIQEHFPTVREASGTLKENVADCDLVLFCGTSAGLEAIQLGRVGVYVGLNDFFVMNPCFNDLTDMQPCMTAVELGLFLKKWRTMSSTDRQRLLSKQRATVQKFFSPIDRDVVQKTLS